jgi:hypothetical protein
MKKPSPCYGTAFFNSFNRAYNHVNLIMKDKVLPRVRFLTILVNCFHQDGFCWFQVFNG